MLTGIDLFVCVKPALVIEGTARFGRNGTSLDSSCGRYSVDPGNACALESALRMRERGEVDHVVCLTAGPEGYDSILCWCMAAGADRVLRVDVPEEVELDTRATGALLAKVIRWSNGKLVLTSQRSSDEGNGLIAAVLASDLGAVYLSNSVHVQLQAEEVRIERKVERGHRQLWAAKLPVVVAVEPDANRPRYVSIAMLALARQGAVEVLAAGDIQVELIGLPRLTEQVHLAPGRVRVRRHGVGNIRGTAVERLQAIMGSGTATVSGKKVLTGSANELADRMIAMMEDHGLLRHRRD